MGNACIIINNDITNTVIIIIFSILENVLDRCQDSIINISIITSISVIDNDITIYIKIKIKCDIIADPVFVCCTMMSFWMWLLNCTTYII